ncbi:transcription elongation factor [Robertkochia flava]|uniref:transcription elongation factor n=1 Tax=Robertkochia flava TaxID=3447986 RepID=UPI001CCB1E62|nr:transcription elongation factor [Robertkochia marina]
MIKKEVYQRCMDVLNGRIEKYRNEIALLKESAENEDHHKESEEDGTTEGGYGENYTQTMRYLDETLKLKEQLKHIDIFQNNDNVKMGSLVHTDRGTFFLSVPLGILEANGEKFTAISGKAPVAELLLHKKEGETITFNNNSFTIQKIE